MEKDEIIELLKNNVRLGVTTRSEYNGGMYESLYSDIRYIQLILFDEVISEIAID
jgi:hypothetical protein